MCCLSSEWVPSGVMTLESSSAMYKYCSYSSGSHQTQEWGRCYLGGRGIDELVDELLLSRDYFNPMV